MALRPILPVELKNSTMFCGVRVELRIDAQRARGARADLERYAKEPELRGCRDGRAADTGSGERRSADLVDDPGRGDIARRVPRVVAVAHRAAGWNRNQAAGVVDVEKRLLHAGGVCRIPVVANVGVQRVAAPGCQGRDRGPSEGGRAGIEFVAQANQRRQQHPALQGLEHKPAAAVRPRWTTRRPPPGGKSPQTATRHPPSRPMPIAHDVLPVSTNSLTR